MEKDLFYFVHEYPSSISGIVLGSLMYQQTGLRVHKWKEISPCKISFTNNQGEMIRCDQPFCGVVTSVRWIDVSSIKHPTSVLCC